MGLSIEVGMYADLLKNDTEGAKWMEETFENINDILGKNGVEPHIEPIDVGEVKNRAEITSFPYSYLHYLRRFYAYVESEPDWIPTPFDEGAEPTADSVLEDELCMFSSHLLCHSDCEGYYLPMKFCILEEEDGWLVGSSYKLFDELIFMAPKLGIKLENKKISDEEINRLYKLVDNEEGFFREYMVWIALYEAARLSIENKTAIIFC